jgi:hypothetical protein
MQSKKGNPANDIEKGTKKQFVQMIIHPKNPNDNYQISKFHKVRINDRVKNNKRELLGP